LYIKLSGNDNIDGNGNDGGDIDGGNGNGNDGNGNGNGNGNGSDGDGDGDDKDRDDSSDVIGITAFDDNDGVDNDVGNNGSVDTFTDRVNVLLLL